MKNKINRVIIIVLDAVGIGEAPDAAKFGDVGSNTLGNLSKAVGGLKLPNMEKLGLGKIEPLVGVNPKITAIGDYGKMQEQSGGKDTTAGHWEIAGVITKEPFPTYPHGFPEEVLAPFRKAIGRDVLGNIPASGTEIIKQLGEEHVKTKKPIVYTSADSVFQIACHEEVYPIEELYKMCEIARKILTGKHAVGRVIARPFLGSPGNFQRTERRKDFSLEPFLPTILDKLKEAQYDVVGIGKIEDIFAGCGLTEAIHTKGNPKCTQATIDAIKANTKGLIFTNLVDTDMIYGHRNDCPGFHQALIDFDNRLPEIQNSMRDDDLLIISADHGCDPTTPSTDHSREFVPLLVYGKKIKPNINLGTRETYADVSATIADLFNLEKWRYGKSFQSEILS